MDKSVFNLSRSNYLYWLFYLIFDNLIDISNAFWSYSLPTSPPTYSSYNQYIPTPFHHIFSFCFEWFFLVGLHTISLSLSLLYVCKPVSCRHIFSTISLFMLTDWHMVSIPDTFCFHLPSLYVRDSICIAFFSFFSMSGAVNIWEAWIFILCSLRGPWRQPFWIFCVKN